MLQFRSIALAVALLVMTIGVVTSQEPAPAGAFRAVHLVNLTPEQVAALQAWMADMNAAIDKAGHKDIRYRLYKVIGKQAGKYEHMWESSWPSGDVYKKIHDSPEWRTVSEKHPGIRELLKDEIYNRYVEVPATAR
jgi:hypothetical protein